MTICVIPSRLRREKEFLSDDNGGNHKRHTSQNGAFREIEIIIVLEFDCSFPTFRFSIHNFSKEPSSKNTS